MATWQADGFRSRPTRETVLLATCEHDNGWLEVDALPTVDRANGRPHHFMTAPDAVKRGIWPRGVTRLESTDPAAAALVAQHSLTVLERQPSPEWQAFFATMEAERDRILAGGPYETGLPALLTDYRMVFLGDLLSLIFCCGWRDRFRREGYDIRLEEDDALVVRPDPFGGQTVELTAYARRIPARRYGADDDLRRSLADAPEIAVVGRAVGN